MKASKDTYYGLDIQKEYIAVVQYSLKSNAVTLVALQPISGSGADSTSKELGTLKSKFKFLNPQVNCSLPVEHAVVKTIPVDSHDSNTEQALTWELEQNIIGSTDEYIFDYQQFDSTTKNTSLFQAVAYRKDRINALSSLLKSHKLVPQCIDLDVFALVNVFEASYPELIGQPAVIVHAESADARILLTHHGKLIDYECIRFDPEPDPQLLSNLLTTIFPRLGYASGSAVNIGQTPFFAAGSLFSQDGFIDSIKHFIPGISLLHPFKTIECRIGVDEEKLASYLAQLCVAVGLAIRGDQ